MSSQKKEFQSEAIEYWSQCSKQWNKFQSPKADPPDFNLKKYCPITIKDTKQTYAFLLLLPWKSKSKSKIKLFNYNKSKLKWFNIILNDSAITKLNVYRKGIIQSHNNEKQAQTLIIDTDNNQILLFLAYNTFEENKKYVIRVHITLLQQQPALLLCANNVECLKFNQKYYNHSMDWSFDCSFWALFSYKNHCHVLIDNPNNNDQKKHHHVLNNGYFDDNGKYHEINSFYKKNLDNDFNVIIINDKLYVFETHRNREWIGNPKYYWTQIHYFDDKNNKWILKHPSWSLSFKFLLKYECVVPIKGGFGVFNQQNGQIWLISFNNNNNNNCPFLSKYRLPICANSYQIINLSNNLNDELLIYGYIKNDQATPYIPLYQAKLIKQFYCNEQIYILCLRSDDCYDMTYPSNPRYQKLHEQHAKKSWIINVDYLFFDNNNNK